MAWVASLILFCRSPCLRGWSGFACTYNHSHA